MKKIVVFDIGGTNIKVGIFTIGKGLIESSLFPTNAKEGGEAILQRVKEKITYFQTKHDLVGIGISSAGQVDVISGEILAANDNLPSYEGINVKEYFEDNLDLPTVVDNDLNCSLLAELNIGNHSMGTTVMVSIGTGVGSSFAIGGKLYRGNHFCVGEIGYLPLGKTTLEEQASMSSLIAASKKILPMQILTGYDVFHYAQVNSEIENCVSEFFNALARGLAAPIFMLDIDNLIIGGGVAERDDFLEQLAPHLKECIPENFLDNLTISLAKAGNESGLLGAASLWISRYESQISE